MFGRQKEILNTIALSLSKYSNYSGLTGDEKNRQQDYYRLFGEADKQADCSAFIEFLLQSIQESLHDAIALQSAPKTRVETRVDTPKVKTEDRILEVLKTRPELSLAEVAATIGRSVRL